MARLFAILAFSLLLDSGRPFFEDEDKDDSAETDSHDPHLHDAGDELFLCKWCGREVFRSSEGFVHIRSTDIVATREMTTRVAGSNVTVTVQKLVNPDFVSFDLVTTKTADVELDGKPSLEATWFHGYAWTGALCPQCGRHIGWTFTLDDDAVCPHRSGPVEEEDVHPAKFHGLIIDKLTRENFVSHLVKLPRIKNIRLK